LLIIFGQQYYGDIMQALIKDNLNAIRNSSAFLIKAITIFLTLIVIKFMFGSLDTKSIALLVFLAAGIIFSAAFISAIVKDRVQRRRTSQQTVFEA
jgi:hypothetical protein